MKIYLAARWGRKAELRQIAAELVAMGHVVTSTWLDTSDNSDGEVGNARPLELSRRDAERVLRDIGISEVVVSFTEPPGIGPMRGGRHVEFGVGLGQGKELWAIGFHENIFHALAGVRYFPTWSALKLELMYGDLLCRR